MSRNNNRLPGCVWPEGDHRECGISETRVMEGQGRTGLGRQREAQQQAAAGWPFKAWASSLSTIPPGMDGIRSRLSPEPQGTGSEADKAIRP